MRCANRSVKILGAIIATAMLVHADTAKDLKDNKAPAIAQERELQSSQERLNFIKKFQNMQQEFDRIFGEFNTNFINDPYFKNTFNDNVFHKPLLDMTQNGSKYLIKMDIPGAKNSNIQTTVENNILTVKAEVDEFKESNTSSFVTKERYINKVHRSISLPQDADSSKMKSDYKDGVLTITLPKM